MNLLLLLASSTSFTPSSLPNLALWLDPNPGTAQGTTAGNAASFPGTTGNNLSAPDAVSLGSGGSDFWVAGWFKLTSLAATNYLVWKGGASGSSVDYGVSVSTSGVLTFRFGYAGGGDTLTSGVTVSTGNWYFFVACFDQTAVVPSLLVNNATQNNGSFTGPTVSNASAFKIGAYASSGSCNGVVDSVAFGKVAAGTVGGLLSAISASLYNSGAGKNYANLTSGEKTAWGLQSYWDLQDTTWVDSHGTNNLTANGTVSQGTGITQVPTTISYGCFKDGAASFDGGSGNKLSTTFAANVLNTGSISYWGRRNSTPSTTDRIFSLLGGGAYEVYSCFDGGTGIQGGVYSNGSPSYSSAGKSTNLSEYFHGVLVWDAAGIQFYVNGVLVASYSGNSNVTFSAGATLTLGNTADNARPLTGDVDSFGLWDGRSLTQAEVLALFNSGAGFNYADVPASLKTNMLAWYNLDETTGTRYDSHGSNSLTMSGTVGWAPGIVSGLCGDGDPVAKWVARTGQVYASHSVAGRPTYRTNGGKPYLQGDGVDDFLLLVGDLATPAGSKTISEAARKDVINAGVNFQYGAYDVFGNIQVSDSGVKAIAGYVDSDSSGVDRRHICAMAASGGNVTGTMYRDGVQKATATTTQASTYQKAAVFGYQDSPTYGFYFQGRIYSHVVHDRVLDAAEVAKLDAYLATRL